MARRKGGGGLRWLLTYADMITLLMAFFIMMYSMSVLNLAKFREVAFSIRSGFGGALEGGAHGLLDTIAGIIRKIPNAVVVEGHTCSLPIHTPRFPSNWELSAQRATAVVRYFL